MIDSQTHADGCHAWGPRHYACAEAEIARLKALNAEMLAAVRAFVDYDEHDDISGVSLMLKYNTAINLARAAIAKAEGGE